MEKDLAMHYVCTLEEAMELIQTEQEFFVSNCGCRESKGECKRSRMDVCLMFNGGEDPSGSDMHQVSFEEVIRILEEARTKKLVARPFRNKDRTKTDGICFCCDDCCGYFLDPDEECDKGQFIEKTEMDTCVHCGACVLACYFGARKMVDARLRVNQMDCYGCGICKVICPAHCIEMTKKGI